MHAKPTFFAPSPSRQLGGTLLGLILGIVIGLGIMMVGFLMTLWWR